MELGFILTMLARKVNTAIFFLSHFSTNPLILQRGPGFTRKPEQTCRLSENLEYCFMLFFALKYF